MLSRERLTPLLEKIMDALTARRHMSARNYSVRMSSGTTGKEPLMLIGEYYWRPGKWNFPGKERMLVCYGSRTSRVTNLLRMAATTPAESPTRTLLLDGGDLNDGLTRLIGDFKPKSILGFPSFIARVAPYFDEEAARGVERIMMTGEMYTEALETLFKERFPNAFVSNRYTSTETLDISTESSACPHLKRNHYHIHPWVQVEIREPDESGAGEVVVSRWLNREVQLRRYRTGDMGRLHAEPCACGAPVTLELLGRIGYDYIKVAGAILMREDLERILAPHAELFDDYRVEISATIRDAYRGAIRVIFHKDAEPDGAVPRLTDALRQLPLTPTRTLGMLIEQGLFEPLDVRFTNEPFPVSYKDKRIRHVD